MKPGPAGARRRARLQGDQNVGRAAFDGADALAFQRALDAAWSHLAEGTLLHTAHALQQATDFHLHTPESVR